MRQLRHRELGNLSDSHNLEIGKQAFEYRCGRGQIKLYNNYALLLNNPSRGSRYPKSTFAWSGFGRKRECLLDISDRSIIRLKVTKCILSNKVSQS